MKTLLREAAWGLLIRLGRAIAFLLIISSLRRPAPPAQPQSDSPMDKQPVRLLPADNQLLIRTAADIEAAARTKLGWPE